MPTKIDSKTPAVKMTLGVFYVFVQNHKECCNCIIRLLTLSNGRLGDCIKLYNGNHNYSRKTGKVWLFIYHSLSNFKGHLEQYLMTYKNSLLFNEPL